MIGAQADSSANCRFNSHQIGKSRNENGAINPRHFFVQNPDEKGFFYSFNVEGKGRCAALYRAASSDRRERP